MLTNKNKKFLIDFGPKDHYDNADIGEQIRSKSPHRKADFDRHLEHANSLANSQRNDLMDHLSSYASNEFQREQLIELNSHRSFHSTMSIISNIAKNCGNNLMKKLLDRHGMDLKEWVGHEVYNNKNAKDAVVNHLKNSNEHDDIGFSLDASSWSNIPEVRNAAANHVAVHIEDGYLSPRHHARIKDALNFSKERGHPELHDKLKSIGYINENEHDI